MDPQKNLGDSVRSQLGVASGSSVSPQPLNQNAATRPMPNVPVGSGIQAAVGSSDVVAPAMPDSATPAMPVSPASPAGVTPYVPTSTAPMDNSSSMSSLGGLQKFLDKKFLVPALLVVILIIGSAVLWMRSSESTKTPSAMNKVPAEKKQVTQTTGDAQLDKMLKAGSGVSLNPAYDYLNQNFSKDPFSRYSFTYLKSKSPDAALAWIQEFEAASVIWSQMTLPEDVDGTNFKFELIGYGRGVATGAGGDLFDDATALGEYWQNSAQGAKSYRLVLSGLPGQWSYPFFAIRATDITTNEMAVWYDGTVRDLSQDEDTIAIPNTGDEDLDKYSVEGVTVSDMYGYLENKYIALADRFYILGNSSWPPETAGMLKVHKVGNTTAVWADIPVSANIPADGGPYLLVAVPIDPNVQVDKAKLFDNAVELGQFSRVYTAANGGAQRFLLVKFNDFSSLLNNGKEWMIAVVTPGDKPEILYTGTPAAPKQTGNGTYSYEALPSKEGQR